MACVTPPPANLLAIRLIVILISCATMIAGQSSSSSSMSSSSSNANPNQEPPSSQSSPPGVNNQQILIAAKRKRINHVIDHAYLSPAALGDPCEPDLGHSMACSDDHTVCEPIDQLRSDFRCLCKLGFFYNRRYRACRLATALGEHCVSNEECAAADRLAFCDYGPVYRHKAPVCSCRPGVAFDEVRFVIS